MTVVQPGCARGRHTLSMTCIASISEGRDGRRRLREALHVDPDVSAEGGRANTARSPSSLSSNALIIDSTGALDTILHDGQHGVASTLEYGSQQTQLFVTERLQQVIDAFLACRRVSNADAHSNEIGCAESLRN